MRWLGVTLALIVSACGAAIPLAPESVRQLPIPSPRPRPSSSVCTYYTQWTVRNEHRGPIDELQTIAVSTSVLPTPETIVYTSPPLRQFDTATFVGPSGLTLHASYLWAGAYYHSSAHASDECPAVGTPMHASWTYTGEAVMTSVCLCGERP